MDFAVMWLCALTISPPWHLQPICYCVGLLMWYNTGLTGDSEARDGTGLCGMLLQMVLFIVFMEYTEKIFFMMIQLIHLN